MIDYYFIIFLYYFVFLTMLGNVFASMQMKPHFVMDYWKMSITSRNESNPFQVWQKSGSCPEGTIPIRRVCEQDLLRTNSLNHFGKKFPYANSKLGPEISRSVSLNLNINKHFFFFFLEFS